MFKRYAYRYEGVREEEGTERSFSTESLMTMTLLKCLGSLRGVPLHPRHLQILETFLVVMTGAGSTTDMEPRETRGEAKTHRRLPSMNSGLA